MTEYYRSVATKERSVILQCVFNFIAVFSAWTIALMFLQSSRAATLYNSIGVALISTTLTFVMLYFKIDFDFSLVLFIFMAFIIQLQERKRYENAPVFFAVAASAYSVFRFTQIACSSHMSSLAAYGIAVGVIALFFLLALVFNKNFPSSNWAEYFADKTNEDKVVRVNIYYVFTAVGVLILCETILIQFITPGNLWSILSLTAFFTLFFWGDLYVVCLMIANKKERLTTLVEKQYRDEMQTFMNVIRSQRHDYNFHVQTLSGILREGNVEQCRKYLDNLVKDSIEMNSMLPINDLAVSSLINSFRIMAIQKGIELHIEIKNDLSSVVTNVYETNKIIGNLLQNAIDETETHKDKSYGIYLYILKRGEFCLVRVANEIENQDNLEQYLKDVYKHGYSTKVGHEGIGLSSIKTLLNKYKGTVYTRVEGNVVSFVAKIPMKLSGDTNDK